MRLVYAKRLHNRDQVEVRVAPRRWTRGYVLGDCWTNEGGKAVYCPVQTESEGFLPKVRHTDLR